MTMPLVDTADVFAAEFSGPVDLFTDALVYLLTGRGECPEPHSALAFWAADYLLGHQLATPRYPDVRIRIVHLTGYALLGSLEFRRRA